MKITDLFSRIQKGSLDSEAGKAARLIKPVQPVGHVGRLTLVPGQLLQGEVVGEDVNGLLLLKLAGEIISARTPMKLEVGQQFWFEVKEAGDSPLLNLASQKGAIQDLLKDIMATRLILVKPQPGAAGPASAVLQNESVPGAASQTLAPVIPGQPAVEVAGQPPASQASPPAPATAAVVTPDGSLPPEATRLVRALVAYLNQPAEAGVSQGQNGSAQSPPLLKTIVSLIREGQIPASLQKNAAFQDVIQARPPLPAAVPSEEQSPEAVRAGGEFSSAVPKAAMTGGQSAVTAGPGSAFSSSPQAFAPETIKILNALVAVAGIKLSMNGDGGVLQPASSPDRNLGEILTLIAREGKIPAPLLQKFAPLQLLLGSGSVAGLALKSELSQSELPGLNEISGQGLPAAGTLLPLQFSAAQQGGESLPAQLRLLASLMGLGAQDSALEGWQEIEEIFSRLSEAEMPAAARKLASFFEAHARVNAEVSPQGQSDFYIMPSIFTGQAGWGEWLWSREHSAGQNDRAGQENLAFFLEMSNLGALTIQVILKDKKLRGQIVMADKKGSELVAALLPGLMERLEAFGYDVVDFSCSCQPLNIMQELKASLYCQAGSGPASLLDVQA